MVPEDKIRLFAQFVKPKSLVEKRQIAEEIAREKQRLERRIQLLDIQADVMYYYVTTQALEEQWAGLQWLQYQLKQMDCEMTASLSSSLGMSHTAGAFAGGGAGSVAGGGGAAHSVTDSETDSLAGTFTSSAFRAGGGFGGGFQDFNDEELNNLDLDYYKN